MQGESIRNLALQNKELKEKMKIQYLPKQACHRYNAYEDILCQVSKRNDPWNELMMSVALDFLIISSFLDSVLWVLFVNDLTLDFKFNNCHACQTTILHEQNFINDSSITSFVINNQYFLQNNTQKNGFFFSTTTTGQLRRNLEIRAFYLFPLLSHSDINFRTWCGNTLETTLV